MLVLAYFECLSGDSTSPAESEADAGRWQPSSCQMRITNVTKCWKMETPVHVSCCPSSVCSQHRLYFCFLETSSWRKTVFTSTCSS